MSDSTRQSAARRLAAYSFLVAFANDGTLDNAELTLLEKIALEDGVVDEEEKKVLSGIFSRVSQETVSEETWREIQRLRETYGIH